MDAERLGFGARLWLALILPWRLLFDAALAERIQRASAGEPAPTPELPPAPERAPEPTPQPAPQPAPEAKAPDYTPALQLLGILQREGRLIDFLQEDVSGFEDAQIGAAARVVHEGCKRGLDEYIELTPIREEPEGADVVLEAGFDPARTRVTGNVVGEPPFRGRLAHHGWYVARVELPTVTRGHDPKVVAQAEVEL